MTALAALMQRASSLAGGAPGGPPRPPPGGATGRRPRGGDEMGGAASSAAIDRDELARARGAHAQRDEVLGHVLDAVFTLADKNGNGEVEAEELVFLLGELAEMITRDGGVSVAHVAAVYQIDEDDASTLVEWVRTACAMQDELTSAGQTLL